MRTINLIVKEIVGAGLRACPQLQFHFNRGRGWNPAPTSLLLAICLLSFATPSAHSAFEDTGTGARGTALGSNYVSMGDDVLSLMYNPAELARVHDKELTTEYSRLYMGLSDGSNLSQAYFGYGQPIAWGGTLAFGWKQLSLDNLYTERTLSLGYGEWVTDTVAIGGAVKQLHHSFGAPNITVDDNGNITQSGTPSFFAQYGDVSTAYSSDLGVLYRMTDRHTLGISVQDVNEPNVALNPADHEIVPRTVQMSLSYAAARHLTLAGALSTQESLSNEQDYTWTGSAEKVWTLSEGDAVSVRGSLATGSRQFQQGVVGAGYQISSLQMDYAFVFSFTGITPGTTVGTHRFSLTYRFGPTSLPAKAKAKPKPPKAPEQAQPPLSPAVVPQGAPATRLPRAVDIIITPEDIDQNPVEGPVPAPAPAPVPLPKSGLNLKEIQIDTLWDSDYDGVPDYLDKCPGTAPGAVVDANGCSADQLDHHGNPLPKNVIIEFLPPEEGAK
jgi:hypothetical protein